MFSFDQLRGFVTVAEELHFGRAADLLNMTQPPLSRQIQKLERTIGVRLFDRDNRRVALTPAGRAFLAEAIRLLALADGAPDLARRIAAGSAGTVRIGFTAASTYGVMPSLINQIAAAFPAIDLDLREMVTGEQIASLAAGEIDLGLGRPPFDAEVFGSHLLLREELRVAVPVGHRLAQLGRPVEADDLVNEPLIMHSSAKAGYFYDLAVSLVPNSHRNVAHSVSQVLTMVWLVAAGRGVALVPDSTSRLGIEGVEYLPLLGLKPKPVELHLLWLRDSSNAALAKVLSRVDQFDIQ